MQSTSFVTFTAKINTAKFICQCLMYINRKKQREAEINKTVQPFIHSFIHSFIHLACAECDDYLPFSEASFIPLCYVNFFLPSFSTNYSSILSHLILSSISCSISQSCCSQINIYIIPFWEFYFLPFSVHTQTNVLYLTFCLYYSRFLTLA